MSATSCNPAEMHGDIKKEEERDLHQLALHCRIADISFVLSLTHSTLIPPPGWDRELGDNGGPPSQMGVGKIGSVGSTIKMDKPKPCLICQWHPESLRNRDAIQQGLTTRSLCTLKGFCATDSHRPLAKLSSIQVTGWALSNFAMWAMWQSVTFFQCVEPD